MSQIWYLTVTIFISIAAICLKANDMPAAGSHGVRQRNKTVKTVWLKLEKISQNKRRKNGHRMTKK